MIYFNFSLSLSLSLDLVISVLRLANDSEEYSNANMELQELEPKIKQLAATFEKPGVSKSE